MSRQSPKQGKASPGSLEPVSPQQEQIEVLAYQLWLERGSPVGSPEEDWQMAEMQLKRQAGQAELASRL